jgi:hypothetical protein
MILGDFTNRSSSQQINKETSELKDIADQMALTDIYIVFHPPAA